MTQPEHHLSGVRLLLVRRRVAKRAGSDHRQSSYGISSTRASVAARAACGVVVSVTRRVGSGGWSGGAGGSGVASNAYPSNTSSWCEDQVSWEVASVAHFQREPSSGLSQPDGCCGALTLASSVSLTLLVSKPTFRLHHGDQLALRSGRGALNHTPLPSGIWQRAQNVEYGRAIRQNVIFTDTASR